MGVVKDLIQDAQITRHGDGYEAERVFMVDVLGGLPESKLYNAITSADIPQYNDPHPILPDVRVTRIMARPATAHSPSTYKVTVTYSVPDPDDNLSEAEEDQATESTVTMTTALASEQEYTDVNNDFLIATWSSTTTIFRQMAQADVQRPQLEVSFRRVETAIPKATIQNFLGKVNASAWSGFPKKTWLCTKIDVSQDRAGKFEIDYSFQYKPSTWRLIVVVNLTADQVNELPPDVESGNGFAVYDVYETADFNQLGLSF